MRLTSEQFRRLVAAALDELPKEFHRLMKNVEVVVEERPPAEVERRFEGLVLGLYQGVPLSRRGTGTTQLPDKISIYQRNIERICSSPAEVRERVRTTIMHEVGHHFGLNEKQLRDAGY
ncbi:MAG: metallopeptidase family protein [Acidobacteriota bacterium]